jgi:5-methylcytosine-specific restriction protein A
MLFDPAINPGTSIDNARLCEIFQCSPQGGMRRSTKTGTLVLVSNHVESIYNDRWLGDVLHYTGMGGKGDQSLTFMQNKTLEESERNGVDLHLFEVNKPQAYTYVGRVRLDGAPYQEAQPDSDDVLRNVWVFPLRVVTGQVPVLPEIEIAQQEAKAQRVARRLSDLEIRERASRGRSQPGQRQSLAVRFERDVFVSENAKRRAQGRCELCNNQAPFSRADGEPYLETHHIVWLAQGGSDTVENTVALCPNCHRKMHVLKLEVDVAALKAKTKR